MQRLKNYRYIFCTIIFLSFPGTMLSYLDFEKTLSPRGQGAIILSMVAVAMMTNGIYEYYNSLPVDRELRIIEEKYPYAQVWYNDIINKYPSVHFDTKKLLRLEPAFDGSLSWKTSYHQIYCAPYILNNINKLYDKKVNGKKLADDDELYLDVQEFIILCQVGAIEQYHMLQRYMYTFGLIMSLECVRILYKDFTDDDAYKYYASQDEFTIDQNLLHSAFIWEDIVHIKMRERNKHIFAIEFLSAIVLPWFTIDILQKSAGCAFACKHADSHALQQNLLFFETFADREEEWVDGSRRSTSIPQWYYDFCDNSKASIFLNQINQEIKRRAMH